MFDPDKDDKQCIKALKDYGLTIVGKAINTNEQLEEFGKEYQKWVDDNNHLPNLQDVDRMVGMIKQRKAGGNQQPGNVPNPQINTLTAKVQALEVKMNKLMDHFGVK